jgi:hypothetical protein
MEPDEKDGVVVGYKLKQRFPRPDKKFKLEQIAHFFYVNPFSLSQGHSPREYQARWLSRLSRIPRWRIWAFLLPW